MRRTSSELIARDERWGAHNDRPLDVVLVRGEGAFVWDVEGRRYTDMLSGYAVLNQGHCHPRIVASLIEQARKLSLSSGAFHNDRTGEMLERIAELSGFAKVLPMNSGAEAVETAIKAMRRWGYERRRVAPDRAEIVVANGNFHGRTTTIVGFSDEPENKQGFGPPTPGFVLVPFGDLAALTSAIGPNTVGVLLEPIQGEAGVVIPRPGYLRAVRDVCTAAGVLLCFDEVQTGLGRTGAMFAWQHEDARPDLIVLGKALSGGLYPVSCMCADESIMRVFTPGSHGSTFAGNPLAAAVTVAAIEVALDEMLAARAAALGSHALTRLRGELRSDAVVEIRGRGLMIAIEYHQPIAAEVEQELLEVGILARGAAHGTVIRLLPPLVIREPDLNEALDVAIPILDRRG